MLLELWPAAAVAAAIDEEDDIGVYENVEEGFSLAINFIFSNLFFVF